MSVVFGAWRGKHKPAATNSRNVGDCVCPVCSAGNLVVFLDGANENLDSSELGSSRKGVSPGRILRCRECGFGFRQSRFNQEELTDLYRKMDPKIYQEELRGRERTAERHMRIVDKTGLSGRLLDVGCASGLFLTKAADAGWQVAGVEPAHALYLEALQRLAGRGTLFQNSLEETKLGEQQFDAITLWDVLEHVVDPADTMKRCHDLLKPGGCLFLNVPDLDSFEARLLGRRWPLLLPEHLNYFNRPSLQLCAKRSGLQLLQFGRRRVSFTVRYVFSRLSQHGIPGANLLSKMTQSPLGKWLIPVSLGETYAVFRRA